MLSVDPEVPVELFPGLLVFAPVLVVSGVVVFALEVSGVVVVGAVVVVGGVVDFWFNGNDTDMDGTPDVIAPPSDAPGFCDVYVRGK